MASYLQARQRQGLWFLRIDNIDPPREQAGATQSIINTLHAHGFSWDEDIRYQSNHTARYEHAIQNLRQAGSVYYCRCSRKQVLAAITKATAEAGTPLIYPGTCREKNYPANNAALRFKVHGSVQFHDQIQGAVGQNLVTQSGDFVIKRRDGLYAYQLVNVVDDIADNITEIVRGNDLLDNTPRQIQLTEALGNNACKYMHVPTAIFPAGEKLSKQTNAMALPLDKVHDSLVDAWQFLGQQRLPPNTSIDSFWQAAIEHWNADRIPRVAELVAPVALR